MSNENTCIDIENALNPEDDQELPKNDEESNRTPEPSSKDSFVTDTSSSATTDLTVLRGDFQMEHFKGLPELTLGIIKPDGMKYVLQIEKRIRAEGYNIVQTRLVHLSPEQASNFYYEHYGEPYFPLLVASMSEGPIKVYVLRKKDAVARWKHLRGPTSVEEAKKVWPDSLRAIFGTSGKEFKNVCHASASVEKALEEIRFFFPSMILDPNILDEIKVEDYLKEHVNPTLLEGLAQVCKNKPLDPVIWLSEWLLMNNPNKPKMTGKITLTPT